MSKQVEIFIGDLVDAPNHTPNGCKLIGIWDDMAWLLYPQGGTTVAPIDGIIPHRKMIGHQESIVVTIKAAPQERIER